MVYYSDNSTSNTFVPPPIGYQNKAATVNMVVTFSSNFPINARNAFYYAAQLWSQSISSSETIEIEANWVSLGTGVLGQARSPFYYVGVVTPFGGAYYPKALKNKYEGNNNTDPTYPDIIATFSSNYPNFYFGTDGQPGAGEYDFVTLVLHEIAHGLGISSSARVVNGTYTVGLGADYAIADYYIQNSSSTLLTNFTTGTTALTNFMTSNDIYWGGSEANWSNNFTNPKWYAPTTWSQGSSLGHFDEIYFPAGNSNSLMTPFLGTQEAIHSAGEVGNGVMKDIGWVDAVVVGIEDELEIVGVGTGSVQSTLSVNNTVSYGVSFIDNAPYNSGPSSYSWVLDLFADDGIQSIFSSTSSTFSFTINNITDKNWTRNIDGSIAGRIRVSGIDGDGYYHEEVLPIKLQYAPNTPTLAVHSIYGGDKGCSNIMLNFMSGGADNYTLFQTNNSDPYANIAYTIPGSTTEFEVTGLNETQTYSFSIIANNTNGASLMSSSVIRNRCSFVISLYPNPVLSQDVVYVEAGDGVIIGGVIIISTFNPEITYSYVGNSTNTLELDISNLSNGTYNVIVNDLEGNYIGKVMLKL